MAGLWPETTLCQGRRFRLALNWTPITAGLGDATNCSLLADLCWCLSISADEYAAAGEPSTEESGAACTELRAEYGFAAHWRYKEQLSDEGLW